MLTYEALLDSIWKNRRGGRSYRRQYMDAVFCADAAQATVARARGIAAPIITGARFYLAEDYHQKYYLRQSPLAREFQAIYPDLASFTASTAAARANGYLAGDGDPDQLKSEIDKLGLSDEGRAYLLKAAGIR